MDWTVVANRNGKLRRRRCRRSVAAMEWECKSIYTVMFDSRSVPGVGAAWQSRGAVQARPGQDELATRRQSDARRDVDDNCAPRPG